MKGILPRRWGLTPARSGGDAVAAVVLGLVEPLVGPAEQARSGVSASSPSVVATPRLIVTGSVRLRRLERLGLDQVADALGNGDGPRAIGLRQDDGELLAAVAGEQLLLADAALDPRRQLAQGVSRRPGGPSRR